MTPEVDRELGMLISQMMEAPVTYDTQARMAELLRRSAVRARMIEIGRTVQTAAELRHALLREGITIGDEGEGE